MNRQRGFGWLAAAVMSVAFIAAGAAHGATLYWALTNAPATGVWDTVAANWVDTNGAAAVWTNGADDIATFSQLPLGVTGVVSVVGTVTVSQIVVTNMQTGNRNYTLTNGTINFTGANLIQTTTARDEVTVHSLLAGTNGMIFATYQDTMKIMNTNNSYTGGTTLRTVHGGEVYVAGDGCLGPVPADASATNITLENGAILDTTATCTFHANRTMALTGASGTLASRNGSVTVNGRILSTTANTLYFTPGQYGLVVALGNAGNAYMATNVGTAGFLQLNVDNALPTNSALRLNPGAVNIANTGTRLNMNGHSQRVTGLFTDPVQTNGFAWVCNSAGNSTSTVTVTGASLWDGQIRDGSASGGNGGVVALTKSTAGTLTLAYTNTYTGPTTISGGTLALATGGAIVGSTTFSVYAGGTFDVTNMAPFVLATNGTLKGGGVVMGDLNASTNSTLSPGLAGPDTLTVSGSVTVAGAYLADVDGTSVTSDRLAVSSNLALGATSALTLTVTNPSGLAAAAYPRLTLASYGGTLTGTFGVTNGVPSKYRLDYGSRNNGVIALVGPSGGTTVLVR